MTVIAIAFCLLVVVLAGIGVLSPPRFLDLVRRMTSLQGFYIHAIARIAFGASLYLAAPSSRLPTFVEVTAIVLVVSGVVTPFFSHNRYRQVIEWWSAGGESYIRIWAGGAVVFVLLIAYLLLPENLGSWR